MFSMNDKVSVRQMEILMILNLFSTGALVLPRRVAEIADQDGWIIVIGATLLALVYGYFIGQLTRSFPGETFVEYAEKIATKPIGILLSIGLMLKIMMTTALEVRAFGGIVKQTLLPATPIEVIIITMLLVTAYLVRKGYECRARIAEILIIFVFIPLVFVFFVALSKTQFDNLLPILTTPATNIFKGIYQTAFYFTALELMLMAAPFLNQPKKVNRVINTSVIFVGGFSVVIVMMTLATFGNIDTKRQIWPVMEMMQTIDLPGSFLERQDLLMISFWIISVFAVINAGLYFTSLIFAKIIRAREHAFLVLPFVPIIYFVSLIPDSVVEAYIWMNWIQRNLGIIYILIVPLLLLSLSRVRKLGESSE